VSFYTPRPTFATVLRSFGSADGLPFADALTAQDIQDACDAEGVHFGDGAHDVFTPAVTLWAFLTQCLSASKSCVAAVARVVVLRVGLGLTPCAAGSGGYCKARAKLPETLWRRLTLQVGTAVEQQAPDAWRWHNRRTLLVDGCELSMPDTPANQQAYPQLHSQQPGLGFPRLRMVVLLAFATAGLLGAAVGPCKGKGTGETELFRTLLEQVEAGDVVVADRYYCTWWLLALLVGRGADACCRLHHLRRCDFGQGRQLGKGDHVVRWPKPARPVWLDAAAYEALPAFLEIREVQVVVSTPGFRVRQFVVATTLRDAERYRAADIADLYHQRWHVELDIRALKTTLKMDVLRCKTPALIRCEVWAHLLAYNLTRRVLAQAALAGQVTPRQLSFAGAVQTLNAFRWLLAVGAVGDQRPLARVLGLAVATHRVGQRPGRVEPREVKRRHKVRLLTKPRAERRAELLNEPGTERVRG
jgi:Transposase DDE domain